MSSGRTCYRDRIVGLVNVFRTALAAHPTLAEPAFANALTALYERGRATWPDIAPVDPERFASAIANQLDDAAPSAVAALHADVYLAIGACDGDAAAARACDALVAREVDFAAARLRATATQADDVRSELRRLFFTRDPHRASALATFTGRGDLRGYARVVAARALAKRMQRDGREEELDSRVFALLEPAIDPEVLVLRERYRGIVEAALVAALGELAPRERAVLRFHLVEGWTVDQLAARYATHRSTASRWICAARESLRVGIRSRLAAALVITESQIDSIVALVTSHIEVSLDRLLS